MQETTKEKTEIKISISTSTSEKPKTAGKEVAEKLLKKIDSKPNIVFLFCTSHYEKIEGGFQDLLNGVWDVLPQDVILIGGTVAGFINNKGCYIKGVTALAISCPNMHISIGCGHNTKRSPKKAAKQCVKSLKKDLSNKFKNKLLFSLISGSELTSEKQSGGGVLTTSHTTARLIAMLLSFMQKILQKGFDRNEQVLYEIVKKLPKFDIIYGAAINAATYMTNYQFLNKEVLTQSAVCAGIETDIPFNLNYSISSELLEPEFEITKITKDRKIIKEINNKPAFKEIQNLMGWDEESLENMKWLDFVNKHPLAFKKDNEVFLRPMMMIMADYIGFIGPIEKNKAYIAKLNTLDIVKSFDKLLKIDDPYFGFFVSCIAQQAYLGIKVFEVHEKMQNYFNEKPFLLIYTAAEGIKKNGEDLAYLNETTASAIFHR